jgi:hypothetical protein
MAKKHSDVLVSSSPPSGDDAPALPSTTSAAEVLHDEAVAERGVVDVPPSLPPSPSSTDDATPLSPDALSLQAALLAHPPLPPSLESCAHLLAYCGYALEARYTPFVCRALFHDDELLVTTGRVSFAPTRSPRTTRFHSLCLVGDCARVARILKVTADPDAGDGRPLRLAIRGGHIDLIRLLLEAGARLDLRGSDGATPLLRAVRRGNLDVIALLLDMGANVAETYGETLTALHVACSLGHLEAVSLLVQRGAPLEVEDGLERTPLLVAVVHQKEKITRFLLEKGADPNAGRGRTARNFRQTPLRRARDKKFGRIIQILEQHGGTDE